MVAESEVSATVRSTFEHFDRDGSNTLEKRELSAALRHLGMEQAAEAIELMNRYDSAGRGGLELGQFNALVLDLQAEREAERERAGGRLGLASRHGAPSPLETPSAKPGEMAAQMRSQEIQAAFAQHRVAISELYEHYAKLQGATTERAVRLDPDECMHMRDFRLLPSALSEADVRAAYKAMRAESAQPRRTRRRARRPPTRARRARV